MHISCNAAAGDFNPRSREGSDGEVSGGDMGADISIHAPARGATPLFSFISRSRDISTHAPARGATYRDALQAEYDAISTHAPARGATVPGYFIPVIVIYFNPRSREGSDGSLPGSIPALS